MTGPAQRVEGKISTELPIVIATDDARHDGVLEELSGSGAVFLIDAPLRARQRARLELEGLVLGGQVTACALARDRNRVALRFGALDEGQRRALDGLVATVLDAAGGRGRRHPRLTLRAEVLCRSAEEVRGVMCDLSQGGLGLETKEPLTLGDELTVTVQLGGFPQPIELRGRVLHVRALGPGRHLAGLSFDELAAGRKDVLRDLIQFLVRPKER